MLVQAVAHLLFQLNFAINFLLYCVSGQNFRRAVRALFCGTKSPGGSRTSTTMAENVQLTSLCRRSVHAVCANGTSKRGVVRGSVI